jgi:hypothetical protein
MLYSDRRILAFNGEADQSAFPGLPSSDAVWILQADGGKNCELDSGRTLDDGARSLRKGHIRILDSKKGNNGKMPALCGVSSGTVNSYLIPRTALPQALKLGFFEKK